MTVRDDRGDVKQTTTGFRGPLMVQSLTSAKSKFLSLNSDSHSATLLVTAIGTVSFFAFLRFALTPNYRPSTSLDNFFQFSKIN